MQERSSVSFLAPCFSWHGKNLAFCASVIEVKYLSSVLKASTNAFSFEFSKSVHETFSREGKRYMCDGIYVVRYICGKVPAAS